MASYAEGNYLYDEGNAEGNYLYDEGNEEGNYEQANSNYTVITL